MYTQEVTVNNEVGLHARPATYFIQKANEFKCGIWVEKDERRVNAKSLLGVLSLGIVGGTTITLIADGSDEKEAVEALAAALDYHGEVNTEAIWALGEMAGEAGNAVPGSPSAPPEVNTEPPPTKLSLTPRTERARRWSSTQPTSMRACRRCRRTKTFRASFCKITNTF